MKRLYKILSIFATISSVFWILSSPVLAHEFWIEPKKYKLNKNSKVIDINVLKESGFVPKTIKNVKIFLSGKLDKKIDVKGLVLSKGAKEAIESIGGSIS